MSTCKSVIPLSGDGGRELTHAIIVSTTSSPQFVLVETLHVPACFHSSVVCILTHPLVPLLALILGHVCMLNIVLLARVIMHTTELRVPVSLCIPRASLADPFPLRTDCCISSSPNVHAPPHQQHLRARNHQKHCLRVKYCYVNISFAVPTCRCKAHYQQMRFLERILQFSVPLHVTMFHGLTAIICGTRILLNFLNRSSSPVG